jgi:hypothetical protein
MSLESRHVVHHSNLRGFAEAESLLVAYKHDLSPITCPLWR